MKNYHEDDLIKSSGHLFEVLQNVYGNWKGMPVSKEQRKSWIEPIFNISSLNRREIITEAVEIWLDANPNQPPTSKDLLSACHKIIEADFLLPPIITESAIEANASNKNFVSKHRPTNLTSSIKILEVDDGKNWARRALKLSEMGQRIADKTIECAREALGINTSKVKSFKT